MNNQRITARWLLLPAAAMSLLLGPVSGISAQEAVNPKTKQPAPAPAPDQDKGKVKDTKPTEQTPSKPKDRNQTKPPADKPAEKPTTKDKPAEKPADKPAEKPKTSDKGGSSSDDGNDDKAVSHKVALEESKYRKRMAKIERLRVLATEQGNQQRLVALDKLEAKTTELHDRKIADAKAKLGDEKFKKLDGELSKGRGKSKGVPPGLEKKGVTEHPGKGQGQGGKPDDNDHGKGGNKDQNADKDKGKGKDAEKEKSEKGPPKDKGPNKPDDAGKDKGKDKADEKGGGKGNSGGGGGGNDKGKGKNGGGKP